MGVRVNDGAVGPDRALTTTTIDISSNELTSLAAINIGTLTDPTDAYVEIGLMQGGTNQNNRVAVLAEGYIGSGDGVHWTGRIWVENDTYAYMNVWALSTNTYRLAATLHPNQKRNEQKPV